MRYKHHDLDVRSSPSSWIYSEVLAGILERMDTALHYNRHGTLTGIKPGELYAFAKQYASYCAYISIEGSAERQIFSDKKYTTIIEIETYKRGRNVDKGQLRVITTNYDVYKKIIQFSRKHLTSSEGNTVYCVGQSPQGLILQDLGTINDLLVRDNYCADTLEKADYVVEQTNSDTPNGRLTIINGQPGTGKTHMIKGLIPRIQNALIILLPTRLISEVDGPALVSLLSEWKNDYAFDIHHKNNNVNPAIVLILEDADECLTTRNDSNMSTVSSVLNHTDGIFGSMLDLRLIATTNAHQLEFDQAFTRPGRLCTHITIDKLTAEHASEVYKRITGGKEKIYTKSMTLAEVYADANNNPYGHIEEEKKLGFNK